MDTVTNMILTQNIASLPHYQEGIHVGNEMLLLFSSLVPQSLSIFRSFSLSLSLCIPPIIYTLTGDKKHDACLYKTFICTSKSLWNVLILK